MKAEAIAEPVWSAEEAEEAEGLNDEPLDWASDYPIWSDEAPGWVDAYEL